MATRTERRRVVGMMLAFGVVVAPSLTEAGTGATMAAPQPAAGPAETVAIGDDSGQQGPFCASIPLDEEGSFDGMADDPVATAASTNPYLTTLTSAVHAAGLVDTLNGEGPFTVFAPNNEAFAAVPEADLDANLADTDLLTDNLTYHVIAGESLSFCRPGRGWQRGERRGWRVDVLGRCRRFDQHL